MIKKRDIQMESFACSYKGPSLLIAIPCVLILSCVAWVKSQPRMGDEVSMVVMSLLSVLSIYHITALGISGYFSFACKGTTSQYFWIAICVFLVGYCIYMWIKDRRRKNGEISFYYI